MTSEEERPRAALYGPWMGKRAQETPSGAKRDNNYSPWKGKRYHLSTVQYEMFDFIALLRSSRERGLAEIWHWKLILNALAKLASRAARVALNSRYDGTMYKMEQYLLWV